MSWQREQLGWGGGRVSDMLERERGEGSLAHLCEGLDNFRDFLAHGLVGIYAHVSLRPDNRHFEGVVDTGLVGVACVTTFQNRE